MNFVLERAQEPSTWRGLVLLVTALGVSVSPALSEAIVSVGLAAAGLIAVVTRG